MKTLKLTIISTLILLCGSFLLVTQAFAGVGVGSNWNSPRINPWMGKVTTSMFEDWDSDKIGLENARIDRRFTDANDATTGLDARTFSYRLRIADVLGVEYLRFPWLRLATPPLYDPSTGQPNGQAGPGVPGAPNVMPAPHTKNGLLFGGGTFFQGVNEYGVFSTGYSFLSDAPIEGKTNHTRLRLWVLDAMTESVVNTLTFKNNHLGTLMPKYCEIKDLNNSFSTPGLHMYYQKPHNTNPDKVIVTHDEYNLVTGVRLNRNIYQKFEFKF